MRFRTAGVIVTSALCLTTSACTARFHRPVDAGQFLLLVDSLGFGIKTLRWEPGSVPIEVSEVDLSFTPKTLAVHPTRNVVALCLSGVATIQFFTVHPRTGVLTTAGSFAAPCNANGDVLVFHPTLPILYVGQSTMYQFLAIRVNEEGEVQSTQTYPLNSPNVDGTTLTVVPDGSALYVIGYLEHRIRAIPLGSDGVPSSTTGTDYVPPTNEFPNIGVWSIARDRLFVMMLNSINLIPQIRVFTKDPSGALTSVGATTNSTANTSYLAVHPEGEWAIVSDTGTDKLYFHRISGDTLTLQTSLTVSPGDNPRRVVFNSVGDRFSVCHDTTQDLITYAFDSVTGSATQVARDHVAACSDMKLMRRVADI
ncbi:MAG: beta-propeller fold lactonase family protein [Bacteriovoracia bacterium]